MRKIICHSPFLIGSTPVCHALKWWGWEQNSMECDKDVSEGSKINHPVLWHQVSCPPLLAASDMCWEIIQCDVRVYHKWFYSWHRREGQLDNRMLFLVGISVLYITCSPHLLHALLVVFVRRTWPSLILCLYMYACVCVCLYYCILKYAYIHF